MRPHIVFVRMVSSFSLILGLIVQMYCQSTSTLMKSLKQITYSSPTPTLTSKLPLSQHVAFKTTHSRTVCLEQIESLCAPEPESLLMVKQSMSFENAECRRNNCFLRQAAKESLFLPAISETKRYVVKSSSALVPLECLLGLTTPSRRLLFMFGHQAIALCQVHIKMSRTSSIQENAIQVKPRNMSVLWTSPSA